MFEASHCNCQGTFVQLCRQLLEKVLHPEEARALKGKVHFIKYWGLAGLVLHRGLCKETQRQGDNATCNAIHS